MTSLKDAARQIAWATAALGAIQLAACASGPPKASPSAGIEAAPAPAPAVVTMAPIPNPPETSSHEHRATSHSHSTSTAAKREHEATPAAPQAPAKPATNPALAARLRARGLEELDRGAVGRAVALLSQASQLDPANATIHHDLERAQRVERTVSGSH